MQLSGSTKRAACLSGWSGTGRPAARRPATKDTREQSRFTSHAACLLRPSRHLSQPRGGIEQGARLLGLSGLSMQACSAPASAASAPASSPASSAAATAAPMSVRGCSPGLGFMTALGFFAPASPAGEPARAPLPPRGVSGWLPLRGGWFRAGFRLARCAPPAPGRCSALGGRGPVAAARADGLADGRNRLGPGAAGPRGASCGVGLLPRGAALPREPVAPCRAGVPVMQRPVCFGCRHMFLLI